MARSGSGPDSSSPVASWAPSDRTECRLDGNHPDTRQRRAPTHKPGALMPTITSLIHDGVLATTTVGGLYTATVTTATLTALLARNPKRRRDAQAVPKILLRRRDEPR